MTPLQALRAANEQAGFNRWCGIEVLQAGPGTASLQLRMRPDMTQYSGFLHAGLIATLIDTACGFAAATLAGPHLLASHFSVNCLRPAKGDTFIVKARVVKPGKTQLFTACDLWSVGPDGEKLVANGETLLTVITT